MFGKIKKLASGAGVFFLLGAVAATSASAAPPTIVSTIVSKVSTDSAIFEALVNPQGQEGAFHFEYGPEDCSISACTHLPDGVIPTSTNPVPVKTPVEGLTPGTTYHLRVVASNDDGAKEGPDRIFATYVPASEALPDARAYEQASPVRKNAADARGTAAWVKAAEDGNAISYLSTSGLPGGVGAQEIPAYLSSRGESDWSTQGLLPPASYGSEAYVLGWLPDFSTVFDFANDFAAGHDGVFLARSSADGSLEQIISHGEGATNSTSYVGASADGSQVIFESRTKLPCCAKALAGKNNLYLWDRESDQISLVSVLNDEEPPPGGAVAGPYDWMQTATLPLLASLGGAASNYFLQDMNAVSDAGVYFTVLGAGALYLRTNPGEPQSPLNGAGKCTDPALACTLAVSASHNSPPDPLGSRPAAFMAATPDGKSAFFASPEKLTNDANTGPVQPEPAIERASVSGPPIEEKIPSIIASGLAKDAEHLYWVNPVEGAIGRSDLDGENASPAFIEIPLLKTKNFKGEDVEVAPKPQYVAVDSEHLYWSSEGEGESKEGVIGRADIDGKAESIEAEWIKGASRPRGIALNSEFIYWANAGAGATEEGTISRAKKIDGGGVKQDFVPGNGTQSPQGIAVDGSHIYWSTVDPNGDGGSIRRVELDGSNLEFKSIDVGVQLRGIAVDAGNVYWASQGDEAIGRMPLSEFGVLGICELPSCNRQFLPTTGKPKGLVTDGGNLWWSVNGETVPNPGNDLYRYLPEGAELEDVTAGGPAPNGAEVKGVLGASEDGKRVYFVANGDLDEAGKALAGNCRGKLSSLSNLEFSGQCSLYLAEESAPNNWSSTFIARLDASGAVEESDAMNWTGKSGGNLSQKSAFVSADGGALLFRSQQQLTPYDNEGQPELYRYDAEANELGCLSCNPSGEAPLGAAGLGSIGLSTYFPQQNPAMTLSRSLSADGKRAFFESPDPLVIDDINGEEGCGSEGTSTFRAPSCLDVYEWEAEGTGSCEEAVQAGGCLYLLSTGKSPNASFFADASVDGEDAFLITRSAGLVRQDQDQLQDVYDARVGGGLASQNQVPLPKCESLDSCHGPQSPAPDSESPSTANSGAGNKKHPRKHAKKKHKHKKKQHKQKQARAAPRQEARADERKKIPTDLALPRRPGAAQATPALAFQTPKAAWKITSTSLPTNFAPGSEGTIFVVAENVGAKATEGTITITDAVPAELEVVNAIGNPSAETNDFGAVDAECAQPAQLLTCTTVGPIRPGYQLEMKISVKAPAVAQALTNNVTIKGGGAIDASTSSPVVVSAFPASFGFLPGSVGLDAPFTDPDGAPTTQAGSHPYQLTVDLGFPTKIAGTQSLDSPGHPRDASVDFPPGVIINPAATPVLCTEAELISDASCPAASQVGMASALTKPAVIQAFATPLYNMVPPPGEAASLAFEAVGVGIYIHLLGGVRSDGDYGLFGDSNDLPALGQHPVFGARVDLWGDPTAAVHDQIRGACAPPAQVAKSCPLQSGERTGTALLTLPGSCPADPLRFAAQARSWEEPEAQPIGAEYAGADLAGAPAPIQGCDQLKFEPALRVRPTTNLTDSPSGLDAELSQPQDFSTAGNPNSPSPLRDALVTLPPGFSVNAAQAVGLAVCSGAQIGLISAVGQSPVRISKAPDSCPDASKLGTVEVETPLLAQIDEDNKIVRDAEGKPVPRPLHGDLFLAKPFDNPFNSLLAIYIAIEDPRSGVIAKLAGKVEPDPSTGQLSTRFTENPQLPLQEVRLHLFSGPRASLQTPLTCGSHETASSLTPWAAPALADVHRGDAFELSASPTGGACPTSEAGAPNAPAFSAGTLSPQAKAFSPMVLKLSRADGSQRISALEATLPAGLLARLIGVAQCSEAQIAAAQARSNPEEGAIERAAPSCPPASQVGAVDVGAGAGPSPLHISGNAYLAGPYKNAPLSVVVITPAIAGPFDLGAVVLRSALYIDPTTAQGRVVSDPFPQLLQGIPTDIRSVAVKVDRPNFTLNPTSCNPKSFLATATSTLGQSAALSAPFGLGGCEALGFKPKLTLRLSGPTKRGGHPALRAVLRARPGDANIAATSVALPHSEFIDQAHFRTICTRVQFAASQCPAGSVYGHIAATSPLVDYPLEGPIYLRSSSHKLPDVVAVLKGPPSQPIEVDLAGRVDSVNGGIRTTFETVPDAPVTKAIVTLQGGKKGLFQNSTDICRGTHRATVKMDGQNAKFHDSRPRLQVRCGHKGGGKGKGKGAKRR